LSKDHPMDRHSFHVFGRASGTVPTRLLIQIVCQTPYPTKDDQLSPHICARCKRNLEKIHNEISSAHGTLMMMRTDYHGHVQPPGRTRDAGQCHLPLLHLPPHLFHPCVVVSREDIIRGLCDAHGGDVLLTPIKQILGPFLPGCIRMRIMRLCCCAGVALCRSPVGGQDGDVKVI
jgi:hypothetical protein